MTITQQEVNNLWRAYSVASMNLHSSPLAEQERELHGRWQKAKQELETQEKAAAVQAKADRKAAFLAEFKAAKGKRPLQEVIIDESVVGTFEGWRFATKKGAEIELVKFQRFPTIRGDHTWEALRQTVHKSWASFMAIRVSDQSHRDFAEKDVVAWKAGEGVDDDQASGA